MPNVRRRVERLERFLAPEPASDPYGGILLLALQGLSEQDLEALEEVTGQGKQECQWTKREAAAAKALSCGFEQEVQRAGYRSAAEFQRSSAAGR
jgi:hypothetical protein